MNVGDKYGQLTILELIEKNKNKKNKIRKYLLCKCECGTMCEIRSDIIKTRKDCGCKSRRDKNKRGGLSNTKIFKTFRHMNERCYNKNNSNYHNYGERGICVCDEWKDDFLKFYDWSINHGYQIGLTIERIDNDKNYCPENCTWIPKNQQAANRRTNHLVTAFGETKTVKLWSQDPRCNISYPGLLRRINNGIDPESAIVKLDIRCNIKYIAHRANLRGIDLNRENKIWAIEECIGLGYMVEVDLWVNKSLDGNLLFYISHDKPTHDNIIDSSWLFKNQSQLLIHCKNKDSVEFAMKELKGEWFSHEMDRWSRTSKNHIICYGDEIDIIENNKVIIMMPEHHNIKKIPTSVYGICTDYIENYNGKV